MPGQQPGMDGSAVLLLHRVSGTFPTLTTAGCCPSAAGCRATVCGASRRTTPATSGYWAGPLEGEWSGRTGWCASCDCFIGASAFLADLRPAPPPAAISACPGCHSWWCGTNAMLPLNVEQKGETPTPTRARATAGPGAASTLVG